MNSGDPDYPAATCNKNINFQVNSPNSFVELNQTLITDQVCTAAWNSNFSVLERLVEQEQLSFSQKNLNSLYLSHTNPSSSQLSHSPSSSISYSISPVINHINSSGFGPLHFAASSGNVQITNHLLDSNLFFKNSRDKDGNTPLIWVVSSNSSDEILETLLDHSVDINSQNYTGETALFIASSLGLSSKVELLLENGARTQIANLDGATPLHVASANGHLEVVKMLLLYGAWVNAGDDEEDTAMHWAVREGKEEVLKVLVENGGELEKKNADGESVLGLARVLEGEGMVKMLMQLGAREEKDEDGMELDDRGDGVMFMLDSI